MWITIQIPSKEPGGIQVYNTEIDEARLDSFPEPALKASFICNELEIPLRKMLEELDG